MAYKVSTKVLKDFLLKFSQEQINKVIDDIYPADILDILKIYNGNKLDILGKLPDWMIANIIDEADDDEKYEILTLFPNIKQTQIVEEMSSDELADMLGNIDLSDANKILSSMGKEDAEDMRELLTYSPETAGGIMATEFVSINPYMTVKAALEHLQKEAPDPETAYFIYVLDENGALKGLVSLRDIVVSSFDKKISEIMIENVISIPVDMDQEEVAHLFEKYRFLAMPVVNSDEQLLGIITIDDIIDVIEDENTEDIHRLAGLQEEERATDPLKSSVKSRLPWLFINLLTAILASATVGLFEDTISRVVILATFMPIVSGMGGNAGTQTLTIIVRGIALGDLTFQNAKKILLKEIGVGVVTGSAIGITIAVLGWLWAGKLIFGVVIGLAMILNMVAATFSGFLVPVILKKLKIDPALASAVFVTTVTDVLGFFFFLGLATIFISYLV